MRWQSQSELMPRLMQRLGLRERLRETDDRRLIKNRRPLHRRAFNATNTARRILYFPVLQPALHSDLEQISEPEIQRKLRQRFGAKAIRNVRFRIG